MILPSSAIGLRVLNFFFIITTSIFVTLRTFIRSQRSRNFGADDCFLLAALAAFSLHTAAGLMSIENGTRSDPDAIFHICTITLLCVSSSLHLRKLAKTTSQHWVFFTLIAITVVFNIDFSPVVLFQCAPIQYIWTRGKNGVVMDRGLISVASYGFAVIGACVDRGLVLVSPWFLWEKERGRRTKNCLRVLLVMSICAGTCALIRIPTTKALQKTGAFFLDCVPIAIGSILEPGLGMIAIAASTFQSLWPSFFMEKTKQEPILLMSPHMREKRSLESNSLRESSSVTGAKNLAKPVGFPKVSDENIRDAH